MGDVKCHSCDAPILWGVTEKGKRMPLDAAPIEKEEEAGFVFVDEADEKQEPKEKLGTARIVWRRAATAPGRNRFRSHWATCAKPESFRRPK